MPTPPRPRPRRLALQGRYARVEPLDAPHAAALIRIATAPGGAELFRFLLDEPPRDAAEGEIWCARMAASEDPLYFAVIDRATGEVGGRQALMRIAPEHGVIEIGSILWGPAIARTRVATEALYLAARHVFEELGYRRFEWKCNALHAASRRAAERFGFSFEGVFRQHMWVNGASRDTAWYAMLDYQWPTVRIAFERWLDPANFDAAGRQLTKLDVPG